MSKRQLRIKGELRSSNRRACVAFAGLLLVLGAGCDSSDGGSDGQFDDLLVTANEYQAEALSDGVVTFAEYERALFDAKGCIESEVPSGVEVDGPVPAPDGVSLRLEFSWGADAGDPSEAVSSETMRCLAEYVDLIEAAYLRTHAPSESAVKDEIAALIQCLHDAGFSDVTPESTKQEVGDAVTEAEPEKNSAGGGCIVNHQLGFDSLPDNW